MLLAGVARNSSVMSVSAGYSATHAYAAAVTRVADPVCATEAVEGVTRSARARHSASPIMTTSAGASGRTSPAGTVPTAASSRQSR